MTELDITPTNLFSISEQTKDILNHLDQDVTLYWICQSGVEDTTLETLLERYSTGSSRVKLERIDPDLNPTFAQGYPEEEINNNGVVVVSENRYRYVDPQDIYLEEMDYETYQYVYDFDGENAITSAIDYVVREDLPQISALTGHGEMELSKAYSRAVSLENFTISNLSLLARDAIPDTTDILLICAPTTDISQDEAAIIAQYLAQGGELVLISIPTLIETYPNLYGVLSAYGVSAIDGIILDPDAQHNYYGTTHYLFPDMLEHSITQPLLDNNIRIMLPEAHGLKIEEALPEGVSVTSLLRTSSAAYAKTDLASTQYADGDATGVFSLAAVITHAINQEKSANILWVSCPQLMDASVNDAVSGGNLNFFMNGLNWMCDHEESISIRPKNQDTTYLTINSGAATLMSILVVGIIPLCYLGIGIYIFLRRKRK